MFKRSMYIIAIIGILILTGHLSRLWAVEVVEEEKVIIPDKVSGPVEIDGNLAEAVWQQPAINKKFSTTVPTYGKPMAVDTRVWAAYDKENLYFAFKCLDPEPDRIKTSIVQRDKPLMDDLVGMTLDTLGTKQGGYEIYINPSGIQVDFAGSAVSGADLSADIVWYSAGKITPEGYQVEVRIPLESIRYKSGREVKMGVIFLRQVPHLGAVGSWPEMEGGQTSYTFMATLVYRDLTRGLKLEVLPNFTYSRDSERETADTWDKNTDTDIGVGLKYGITSSITAEAAVNPDFSQVESDAFQVEVNRRYPVFYTEKRPFFMESREVLDFTIIKDSMLISAVHTRNIVDPGWAAKLSGTVGRLNFAVLAANDRAPGRAWDFGLNPDQGKHAFFGIVRAKYNLGSDNSLGILYAGRHFAGQGNDAAGADLKFRFSNQLRASVSYLHTATRQAEGAPLENGSGINAMLQYNSRKLISWGIYERYSTDFYMATAFQNRVGISRGALGIGPILDVKLKPLPWLKRIIPFVHYYRMHDLAANLTDVSWEFAANLGFAPMGEMNIEYWVEKEGWAGQLLDKKYFHTIGHIQLFKWLLIFEDITIGEQLYYHPDNPLVGNGKTINLAVTVQPNIKLKIGFDYRHSDLKEKQTGQELYAVDLYNLHTTYQFNKYFFLRGIVRCDSYQGKLLTDLLASFTLIPGTVVHLGYGSLYLENQWQDNMWIPGQGDLLKMRQGLFFKASYLWRLK